MDVAIVDERLLGTHLFQLFPVCDHLSQEVTPIG